MKLIKTYSLLLSGILLLLLFSCKEEVEPVEPFMYGGDFSILKKMEDFGGQYKFKGEAQPALEIFKANGYNYGRVRLFHTPNMKGPVCNSLEYTIELSKQIKASGMKLLLNFHYSDTWADPQHQLIPEAWKDLDMNTLTDSVYHYSKAVIRAFDKAGVLPDMVQVGNEITPGMMWPAGKIYNDDKENWKDFCSLLNAGIDGVKAGYGERTVPIMIHIDKGGNLDATNYFFQKIEEQGVHYDLIGLSYYPWWHGTFADLEKNLIWLSENKEQDIVLVETAYYANGYYPEPAEWVLDVQPYPPTEEGQYEFLVALDSIARQYPKVKGIFYWKPDGLYIPESKVWYIGRSLFDKEGNAYKGITAWKKD